MRFVIDLLIILMVVGVCGGGYWYWQQQDKQSDKATAARSALARIREQIDIHKAYQDALKYDEGDDTGGDYPQEVHQSWFEGNVPKNPFASPDHAWIDFASAEDGDALNPPDPVLHRPEQAMFWYNPKLGIIRARVALQFSDPQTVALYNEVNGTAYSFVPERPSETEFARTKEEPARAENSAASHTGVAKTKPAVESPTISDREQVVAKPVKDPPIRSNVFAEKTPQKKDEEPKTRPSLRND